VTSPVFFPDDQQALDHGLDVYPANEPRAWPGIRAALAGVCAGRGFGLGGAASMQPPYPQRPALFLDVDGTLLEIVARPQDVRVDQALRHQLQRLQAGVGGALALVSGRPIEELQRLFAPLELPMAGLHGLERRAADGRTTIVGLGGGAIAEARAALRRYVAAHPGLLLEDKGATLAVHYRLLPALEAGVERTCEDVAADLGPEFHVQTGLLVREIKPRVADKGTALDEFMAESPFASRRPVAIGDDHTDLDAFRAAERHGGMGIAVGDRIKARWQLAGPRALRAWLTMLAERIGDLD
jgi:trehalose 6-phosphate phosphatase